jgi:hypothetical protein
MEVAPRAEASSALRLNDLVYPIPPKSPSARKSEFPKLPNTGANRLTQAQLGLNTIRITADAEREWQQQMQEPAPEVAARATERAVKAGDAAVKSENHVSNRRRRRLA